MRSYWAGPVGPSHASAGIPYASSAALTDISLGANNAGPAKTTYAGNLEVGMEIRLRATFTASNTGTPTLLAGFYYGGVAGTALAASSAITTTTAMSNWLWTIEYVGIIRTTGATGTIWGSGIIRVPTSATAWTTRPIPESNQQTAVTIDTTATKVWTLGAQWGTSNASNTATCQYMSMDIVF